MPDLKLHPDESPENPLARVGFFDELNSPNTPAYTLPRVAGSSGQVVAMDRLVLLVQLSLGLFHTTMMSTRPPAIGVHLVKTLHLNSFSIWI